jgi:hypothetical protein
MVRVAAARRRNNGDELTITQNTTSILVGPGFDFTGTAVITGGTGRFESARGTLDLQGTLNFDQARIGHALSKYTGRITYQASDRSE